MTLAQIVVVTGTDTGIGKTYITSRLARHLCNQGLKTLAIKPVESGVSSDQPGAGEDGVILAKATGQAWPLAALTRLKMPTAPPVAAVNQGVQLDPQRWCAEIQALRENVDLILVEGAGGLLSPLADGWTAIELARSLGASVLVVGCDQLGTINHTRLTVQAIEHEGLSVLGVALSAPKSADESTGNNRQSLAQVGIQAVEVSRNAHEAAQCWSDIRQWVATTPEHQSASSEMWAQQQIEQRQISGLLRSTNALATTIRNFSGNDYLGLSEHPAVIKAAHLALEKYGMGPRGSALVCGYTDEHAELEQAIARYCASQAALVLPTGYAANIAAITALCGDPQCAIFSDALNHASIIDGCRMAARAGARLHIYRHCDTAQLERMLSRCATPRKVIITESVFSMDGDHAPLDSIVRLRDAHDATVICDNAHSTLLFAPCKGVDVHIGTLSKAVGTQGGFIACSHTLRTWFLNAGRPYVFSTSLPVPLVAAARESFNVAKRQPERAQRVFAHAATLRQSLGMAADNTPIVPIILGDAQATMEASHKLARLGFHVPGIRPPTVPVGSSRLRITLSAKHSDEDVRQLVLALRQLKIVSRDTTPDR